ncbi:MAG: lipid-binding SYLF domain-containing protein [Synergistaceae bacterium]|jgi:lipid-binding SYLF domain-containing protein|nr:lipid-binding SYLF domain-containing protein [Synergistaceae bacterium]
MSGKFRAIALLTAAVVIFHLASMPQAYGAETQHEKHIRLSVNLLRKMREQSDADSMAHAIKSAKGVAIFPSVVQAGIGLGGLSGEGVILVRQGKGWGGPSFVSIVGGSFGLQIGVKEVGLVLVIINQDGLQAFTGGKSFKLGGDVSIAAGPVGRDAQAATDSRADASIYSYSMSRGLFAGIALSGATINRNADANKAYWGSALDAKKALASKADGAKIKPLVKELDNLSKLSK